MLQRTGLDGVPLACLALQIEARRPGTVPGEMIDGLANMVDPIGPLLWWFGPAGVGELSSRCIGVLRGESVAA